MPLGLRVAVGGRTAVVHRTSATDRGETTDTVRFRRTKPWDRRRTGHLSPIGDSALVLALLGGIVLVGGLDAPLVDLVHGLSPDPGSGVAGFWAGPEVVVVLVASLAQTADTIWVEVGAASTHGIERGEHSVQLLDMVCPLSSVPTVAVKREDSSPVVHKCERGPPLNVIHIRDRPLDSPLCRPSLVVSNSSLLLEELTQVYFNQVLLAKGERADVCLL